MASEEEIKLYNEIISKGCCKRCALRYLGHGRTLITFDDPDICLLNFGHISPLDGIFENFQNKKMKKNPCAVCLDLLSDRMFGELLEHQELSKVSEYLHEHFVAYITFPPCILLRDHSMKIHLKNAFPNVFDGDGGSTAFQAH
jgi:tRNA pseudouridine synthase 10